MSKNGKGGQGGTQVTQAQPWSGAQQPLEDLYTQAGQMHSAGAPPYYPGQTVASQSPYTQTAMGLQAERGLYGSPLTAGAQQSLGQINAGQNTGMFGGSAQMGQQSLQNILGGGYSGMANQQAMGAMGQLSGMAGYNPMRGGSQPMGGQFVSAPGLDGGGFMAGGNYGQSPGMMGGPQGMQAGTYHGKGGSGQSLPAQPGMKGGGSGQPMGAQPVGGVNPYTNGGGPIHGGGMPQGGGQFPQQGGGQDFGAMAGQTYGGLMGGQSNFVNQGLASQGQGALSGFLGGAYNPVSGQAGGAAQGLGAQGANGIGLNQSLAGQAGGALGQQIGQGNAFGGMLPGTMNAVAGLQGANAAPSSQAQRGAAQGLLTDTINGQYTGAGNPYFSGMVDAATRPLIDNFQQNIIPGISSQFSAYGRTGSGAMGDALSNAGRDLNQQIGNISSQLAYNTYGQERGYQNQAANTALQDFSNLRGQDIAAQGTGAQLGGQLYGQGAGQNLAASQAALSALQGQGALQQGANLGLLGNYYTGTGQQGSQLANLMSQYGGQQNLALNAAQGATQANLGYGNQNLGALSQIFGNQNNATTQQLTGAGLANQGFLNAAQQQLAGIQMAPGLANQDYVDINAIGQSGAMQDAYNQQLIQSDIDRYNYGVNAPWDYLNQYASLLYGAPWGTSTQIRQPSQSGFQGALSGAGTGASLGTMIYPGIGTAIGAVGGGLLGWLGSRN